MKRLLFIICILFMLVGCEKKAIALPYSLHKLKEDGTYEIMGPLNESLYETMFNRMSWYFFESPDKKPITSIAPYAFKYGEELIYNHKYRSNELVIPEGITEIKDGAFEGCSFLGLIIIPESVTTMGDDVFKGCGEAIIYVEAESKPVGWSESWNPDNNLVIWGNPNDEKEMFHYGITSNDEVAILKLNKKFYTSTINIPEEINGKKVTILFGDVFKDNKRKKNISKIIIPSSITFFGAKAFNEMSNLYEVEFTGESNLISIGEKAFYDCKKLEKILIPGSVEYIGQYAFTGCAFRNIKIPEGVKVIDSVAFSECASATSVEISSTVIDIAGGNVFNNCYQLNTIEVASANPIYRSESNCLIETSANTLIRGCNTSIIPDGITTIGSCAFKGCKNLVTITIPSSVTKIDSGAFGYCYDLVSITIPESVISIENGAFSFCKELNEVIISSGVEKIGDRAFMVCSDLVSIIIPSSVEKIGERAFSSCKKIKIYCETDSKPEGWHRNWNFENRPVVWGYTGE